MSGGGMVLRLALLLLLAMACEATLFWGKEMVRSRSSNRALFRLNKAGMTGAFSGVCANRTTGEIDYQLWFVNQTADSFTLSLLAINSPPNPGFTWRNWTAKDFDKVEAKVIWTANRNRPVHWGATFTFTGVGNLELKDVDGTLVWESNTASRGVDKLWMTDIGSLILKTASNETLWQSFDKLSDTLVAGRIIRPGMKLFSSVSLSNSSEGPYSLVMENSGLVAYSSTCSAAPEPYWVLSSSNTTEVNALKDGASDSLFATFCLGDEGILQSSAPMYLDIGRNLSSFDATNTAVLCSSVDSVGEPLNLGTLDSYATFLRLQPDGNLVVDAWNMNTSEYHQLFSLMGNDSCELPRKCGPYRQCRLDGKCGDCAPSFTAVDQSRPESGCKPVVVATTESEECAHDTFPELSGYDYFASSYSGVATMSSESCKEKCSSRCSCQAAFYKSKGDGQGQCYTTDSIGTIRQVSDKSFKAYLRTPPGDGHQHGLSSASTSHTGLVVGGAVAACVVLAGGLWLWWKCRKGGDDFENDSHTEENAILEATVLPALVRRFSYKELVFITGGFSERLGAGAYGTVYRGKLSDGSKVAVKTLDHDARSRNKEFLAEIASLARSKHWNLLQLLGFCADRSNNRLLVYEFMENGSLDAWLPSNEMESTLSWEVKLKIAIGTARGLAYLHEDCAEKILHLDLKPPNILLDSEFNPKIGDFGLSKLVDREKSYVMTTMRGTPGYLAPEWLIEGAITEKVDVYSFGMVALELVGGRKCKDLCTKHRIKDPDADEITMELNEVLRSCSKGFEDKEVAAMGVVKIALLCIQDDPSCRPAMSSVVQMLEGCCADRGIVQPSLGKMSLPGIVSDSFTREEAPTRTFSVSSVCSFSSLTGLSPR